MTFGIIGCGRISDNHISAAIAAGMTVTALCDVDSANMRRVKQKYGLTQAVCYADYREMLREPPQLVTVAAGSGTHAVMTIDCLRAGCHVIVEKPMALSLKDCDRMIEEAERRHVKLCVCQQNRFNKSIQKMRCALEAGAFGKLYYGTAQVRWHRSEAYYAQAPWRGTWAQDGGALMNQCIHSIDLLRWMMGDDVREVIGVADNLAHGAIETEDLGLAIVKFAGGTYGLIEGTTNVYPDNLSAALSLFGERGTVVCGGNAMGRIETWRFAGENEEEICRRFSEESDSVYGFGHVPLYRDMMDAIECDRAPKVDGYAGRRAVELVLAIYLSAKEKRAISLPLKDTASEDFDGMFAVGKNCVEK